MTKVKKLLAVFLVLLFLVLLCARCRKDNAMQTTKLCDTEGDKWRVGFGSAQILPDKNSEEPLYIAGYDPGREISGVLDYCQARAMWLDTGAEGVLLIGIDCVALDNHTVTKIRQSLSDIPNCVSINVYATHTHAGIDTMGLWGQIGIDGKNDAYMDALFLAAEKAARAAAADRHTGTLYYGQAETLAMLRDSRLPQVCDETLYQLRFESDDGTAGLRLFFYGAHAEALRGANTKLSRDFPGLLCDGVTEATGDNTMFFPGAIGGLVMTRDLVGSADSGPGAEKNLQVTASKLVQYALSIQPENERVILPKMGMERTVFTVPLDNPIFLTYKFLGIFHNNAVRADSATGYGVKTELSVLKLDDLALALIPGEIFPELVSGEAYEVANTEGVNPVPLREIAADGGLENLIIIGLANDEIGYIVPPADFLVNPELPYLEKIMDHRGEDHYEETNSAGPECAQAVADAFAAAVAGLQK